MEYIWKSWEEIETQYWERTPNAKSELTQHVNWMCGLPSTPPPAPSCFSFFVEMWPQASWSAFSFANPPTMVPVSFWGVPHALHSRTVSFCLISQSPSLPLADGLILKLGGGSVSKARTALRITEWANQYLVTMLFSMLTGINAVKKREEGETSKTPQTFRTWFRSLT